MQRIKANHASHIDAYFKTRNPGCLRNYILESIEEDSSIVENIKTFCRYEHLEMFAYDDDPRYESILFNYGCYHHFLGLSRDNDRYIEFFSKKLDLDFELRDTVSTFEKPIPQEEDIENYEKHQSEQNVRTLVDWCVENNDLSTFKLLFTRHSQKFTGVFYNAFMNILRFGRYRMVRYLVDRRFGNAAMLKSSLAFAHTNICFDHLIFRCLVGVEGYDVGITVNMLSYP